MFFFRNRKFFKLKKEDEVGEVTRDWKFAAMVVDRLCLIVFTLFTIIATLAVLFSAPHFIVSDDAKISKSLHLSFSFFF